MRGLRITGRRWGGAAIILVALGLCGACLLLYPLAALNAASRGGVYARPEDHITAIAGREYCDAAQVVIEHAGPEAGDGSNPHVWFVQWKIYARSHAPCGSGRPMVYQTYDQGGYFYLNTRAGWVWMSEGSFPTYIGWWMKVFNLAGPGLPAAERE